MVSMSSERESGVPASPLDKDRSEQVVAELRGVVARKTGVRTDWSTPLDKETLNSVYAYLSGEFAVPKTALHKPQHPDFEDREHILWAVVSAAGIGGPEDDWSQSTEYTPNSLRKDELKELIAAMNERGDRRDWANHNNEETDDATE